MTAGSDRWRRIEDLFRASSEIPEEQRDVFLREACGADDKLRGEVESLLANDVEESPLIAGIIDDATADMLEEDCDTRENDRLDKAFKASA